jgi:hypothetical protein
MVRSVQHRQLDRGLEPRAGPARRASGWPLESPKFNWSRAEHDEEGGFGERRVVSRKVALVPKSSSPVRGTCKNAVISRHIGFVSRAERRSDAAGVRLRALAFQGPVHRRAGDLEQLGQLSDGVLAGGVQFEQVDLPSDG